jgi:cytoskeletal protein CcmA (bactofilin family)
MWNRDSAVKSKETGESQAIQSATPALPAEERRVVAWVGRSVIFNGTLISSEDMTIDGRVEGTIEARGQSLTIGPNADIRADIVAKTVMIFGSVTGGVRASARVEIRASGRLEGSLAAPRIVVFDGALVRGRVDTLTEPADAKTRQEELAIV